MTTADRIDPISYRSWAPTAVAADAQRYAGKHRRPGGKSFSLHRFFYVARHVNRGR